MGTYGKGECSEYNWKARGRGPWMLDYSSWDLVRVWVTRKIFYAIVVPELRIGGHSRVALWSTDFFLTMMLSFCPLTVRQEGDANPDGRSRCRW